MFVLFSLNDFIQLYFTFSDPYLEYFLILLKLYSLLLMCSRSVLVGLCFIRCVISALFLSGVYEWVIRLQRFNAFVHMTSGTLIAPAQAKHSCDYAGNATAWGNNRPVENISCFCNNIKRTKPSMHAKIPFLTSKTQWLGLTCAVCFPALMHFLLKRLLKTKTCHTSQFVP